MSQQRLCTINHIKRANKIHNIGFFDCADDCGFMAHNLFDSLRHQNHKMASSSTWQSKLVKLRRIYLSVIICSITTFFYHLFLAAYQIVGFQENEDSLCKAMVIMDNIAYISCFLAIDLFLWFRQRTLYTAYLSVTRFTKPLNFSALS